MHDENYQTVNQPAPSVAGSYARMLLAVLVGAALGLGIYFLTANDTQAATGTGPADAICVCPNCGMTVPRPANMDCEEITCPNCGNAMANGAQLAAVAVNPQGAVPMAPMTQNQRETLAEQGVTAPAPALGPIALNTAPMTQNQRETLAERGLMAPAPMVQQPAPQPAPLPANANVFPQVREELKCVCPNCGKIIDKQPGVLCTQVRCPNCTATMTNAVLVGPRQDLRLMAMAGTGTPAAAARSFPAPSMAAQAAPCPGAGGGGGQPAPCPHMGGQGGGGNNTAPVASAPGNASQALTYSNTVSGIVERNCLRCHGGPIRTLRTYDQVKAYADNGLLRLMTQPGGPMSRFLTAHESHQISDWVKAGSPP